MQQYLIHTFRFVLFLLIQALLFNRLEIGWGIQAMVYPLFILLLPYNMNIFLVMIISFALGLGIDSISDTYGLHASAASLVAFLRPTVFKYFEPRDGYEEGAELNIFEMGTGWLLSVYSILLIIHHLWFFSIEIFKLNEIGLVLQKTFLSFPFSLAISLLIQIIFIKRPENKR